MTRFLYEIFGRYTMQVIIRSNMLLEILFCTALFCWYFKRRKYFWLWLALGIVGAFGITIVLAVLNTHFDNIFVQCVSQFVMSGIMLGLLFACFRDDVSEILLSWCGGIAAYQATGALVGIVYALCGLDDHMTISFTGNESLDWFLYYLLHISLYVVFSLVFSRKKLRGSANSMKNIIVMSSFTIVFMIVVSPIARAYESDDLGTRAITKLLTATLYLLVLFLRTGIFAQSKYKQDMQIMNELLREEKKQFESVKANIDVINMKCHDLKHRLSDLEGKLTRAELDELRSAIDFYDTQVKTGNDILDVVLYEKQLVCERENISISCLANGAALGFMDSAHIYSLFSNALGNAIEACTEIADPAQRTISLNVGYSTGLTEITVANRYDGERNIQNGTIATSKDDKARHGYGTKSMRYIAELYGGTVDFSAENGIFTVRILLPPPSVAQ